jgi:hypothetical protein
LLFTWSLYSWLSLSTCFPVIQIFSNLCPCIHQLMGTTETAKFLAQNMHKSRLTNLRFEWKH